MQTPNDVKFAKSHEWLKRGEDDTATVGISDHAQDSLGDITFVELPAVGSTFKKGEPFGVVESVKAASDLYAPASGEVIAVNEELDAAPEKVNQSPYGDGWLLKLKLADPSETEQLLSPEDYQNSL